MSTQTHHLTSLTDLQTFAQQFLGELIVRAETQESAVVLAISGDLGAGKTTFVQQLAKLLGVADTVTSPTFTIMKGYETKESALLRLVHMDAYRIEDIAEVRPLHLDEIFATKNTLVCIEWAERIAEMLPKQVWRLSFTLLRDESRQVVVEAPVI